MKALLTNEENTLSERHPPKQGLKLDYQKLATAVVDAFRATSTKTRIETVNSPEEAKVASDFQSDIHQNKD